ncbi:uncharacterized protein LOC124161280 [Ischnura elegans]|uniref:uncharacterized protein LOC124161280 n=1 Tax=Ischnura elegans TaxID=197161 RepID=UPI001ED881D5|nr:uncharacterized protein LOC124161280 [Ischnura elegans]
MRSPFECYNSEIGEFNDVYLRELKERLETMWEKCRVNDERSRRERAAVYNRGTKDVKYERGQYVYLSDQCIKTGGAKKFHYPWKGPYLVTEVISPCNVRIQLPYRSLLVHKNRLKLHIGNPPSSGFFHRGERRRGRPRKPTPPESAKLLPVDVIGSKPPHNTLPSSSPGTTPPRPHLEEESSEEVTEETSLQEGTEESCDEATSDGEEGRTAEPQRSPYLLRSRPIPTSPEPLGLREVDPRPSTESPSAPDSEGEAQPLPYQLRPRK